VDFDTSHVEAFTQRLNHIDVPESEWVEGAKIVAGWPGDSAIMPERIPGYTAKLAGYGVELVGNLEDLIGRVDAILIESQQGARHLERVRPFLEAGVPAFVDKPFAGTLADAEAMIALAQQHGVPLMSCSSLRYDPKVVEAIGRQEQYGRIRSVDVWGSAVQHPGNPGLLHYGIHGIEMVYALLGVGCESVRAYATEPEDMVLGQWGDGRYGVFHGLRGFGFTAHYEKGHFTAIVEGSGYYREMLKAIIGMFETGTPPIDYAVMREIMGFIEAANRSATENGARQSLTA
jgi:predicted dehydrogenase